MAPFRGPLGVIIEDFYDNIKSNWELNEIWDALPGRLNPHRADKDEHDVFVKWGLDLLTNLSHLSDLTPTPEQHAELVRQMGIRINARRGSDYMPQQQWVISEDVEMLITRNAPLPDGVLPQGAYRAAPMAGNADQNQLAHPAPFANQALFDHPAPNVGQAYFAHPALFVGQARFAHPAPHVGQAPVPFPPLYAVPAGIAHPAPNAGPAGNAQPAPNAGQAGNVQPAPVAGPAGNAQRAPNPGPAGNAGGARTRPGLARQAKQTPKTYIDLSDSDSDLDSEDQEEEEEQPEGEANRQEQEEEVEEQEELAEVNEQEQEDEGSVPASHPSANAQSRKRKGRHEPSPSTEESGGSQKRSRVQRRLPSHANENKDNDVEAERAQQERNDVDGNADHNQDQLQQQDIVEQPLDPDDEVLPTVEDVVDHVGALTFEERYPLPANATITNRIAMLTQLKKRNQKLRRDRHEILHEAGEHMDHEYDYRILIERDRRERGEDGGDGEEEVLEDEE